MRAIEQERRAELWLIFSAIFLLLGQLIAGYGNTLQEKILTGIGVETTVLDIRADLNEYLTSYLVSRDPSIKNSSQKLSDYHQLLFTQDAPINNYFNEDKHLTFYVGDLDNLNAVRPLWTETSLESTIAIFKTRGLTWKLLTWISSGLNLGALIFLILGLRLYRKAVNNTSPEKQEKEVKFN